MAKGSNVGLLWGFMGLSIAMVADFIAHGRHILGDGVVQFTNPHWDLADTSQIGVALGAAIMGTLADNKPLEDFGVGALFIQSYMKVLAAKYNLPRYIIFRTATI